MRAILVSTAFWALLAVCLMVGQGCEGRGPTEPQELKKVDPCTQPPYSCASNNTGCYEIGPPANWVCSYPPGGAK